MCAKKEEVKQEAKQEAKKLPRINTMGATIALPGYSSLRVGVVEPVEGEGLDLQKTALYLKTMAKSLGGTLALPTLDGETTAVKKTNSVKDFFGRKLEYDDETHQYTVKGVVYRSATGFVDDFYGGGFGNKPIAKEYLENASAYGTFIHKIFENAIKGFCSAKPSLKALQTQVQDFVKGLGDNLPVVTEQIVFDNDYAMAGRFDALVGQTLLDWKTNNEMFNKKKLTSGQKVLEKLDYCDWNTTFGSYVLQQNFYAYMLNKLKPDTVTKAFLVWAPDLDSDIQGLEVPLMKPSEVEALLDSLKQK